MSQLRGSISTIGLILMIVVVFTALGACSSSSKDSQKTPDVVVHMSASNVEDTAQNPPTEAVSAEETGERSSVAAVPATPRPKFFLDILSPADESVVRDTQVEVQGETLATAIVSVNGKLVPVDESGRFSTTVNLEDGPNFIEVVASNVNGTKELSEIISVVSIAGYVN